MEVVEEEEWWREDSGDKGEVEVIEEEEEMEEVEGEEDRWR